MNAPDALLISAIIEPPFPNKQPTWFDAITTCAETGDLFEFGSTPFAIPALVDLLKTRTVPFWAGEYSDSGF